VRPQAKVQDLETEVRELRARAQTLELDRSRQDAELDLLRRLVARHGQPAAADAAAAAARVEQLESYVLQLEARQRATEAELVQWRSSAEATAAAAAAATVTREMQLQAQVESQLQAERQAGGQVAQLQATVRRLEAEAQRAERDRARDRAQLDGFRGGQTPAAEESPATVRSVSIAACRLAHNVLILCAWSYAVEQG